MAPLESIAVRIERARVGDREALASLYLEFFNRVAGLARRCLGDPPLPDVTASDIVQSVMRTFSRRILGGEFPDLDGADSLWKLLACIASRKANRARRLRAKREPNSPDHPATGELAPLSSPAGEADALAELISREPDPALLVEMLDERAALTARFPARYAKAIGLRMDEGLNNEEIAKRLDTSLASIERMFATIRTEWRRQHEADLQD